MSDTLVKLIALAEDNDLLDREKTHDPDVTLDALGLDGLDEMELIVAVEDFFDVDLFHFESQENPTLRLLAGEIDKRRE